MNIKICLLYLYALLLIIFLTSIFPLTLNAQSDVLSSKEIKSGLDSYINPYFAQKDFSGTVLIAQGDSILASESYGLANVSTRTKNNINTKFRVASLSKTFTGAAIVILMERNKLKLDDPLSKFFPQFPNGQNITIEQLLRHRSGVGEMDEPRHYQNCYSANQLVEEIGKIKPLFPPGTDNSYSNEGYNLLAAIIEKVSGISYEEFLKKEIFQPLKMNDSGSFCSEPKLKNLAVGYVAGGPPQTIEKVAFSELTQIGAGSAYSTAPDLHKWLKAVNENRLFQIDKLSYPYGWGAREYTGNKLIEQSGLVEGFNSYMALYQKEKLYIIFLSNIQTGLFNNVPRDLKAVVFGGDFSQPLKLSNSGKLSQNLKDYVGKYKASETPLPLNVTLKNGSLYLKWGNYPFFRSLTPVSKDKFFHRAEYAEIIFERNKEGAVQRIIWRAGGNDPSVYEKINSTSQHP